MTVVSTTGLSKSYGPVKALSDFSLNVEEGEVFALVGPDGAGKTTLIRILCHLLNSDAGRALIGGHDVKTHQESVKPLLGYMPQHFSLYLDLSIEENLTFYAGIFGVTGSRFVEKRDQLYSFSNLAAFAKRRAGALSGGMKQKLALSCALIHDPKVLILDEPTTGVDPLSRRQFWEMLLELKQGGATILVSTPYMDEVARADRACFIFGGKKLSEGTPGQLAGEFRGRIYFLDLIPDSSLLNRINAVSGLAARRFGSGLHLYLSEMARPEDYAASLANLGIETAALHPIGADLEDRFIQLMENLQ